MNSHNAKKKRFPVLRALTLLLLATCLLAGCSFPGGATRTTVTIDENGRLTEDIVEDLGGQDYTAEELQSFVESSLAAYNPAEEERIKLLSCRVENGSVKISMQYESVEDYTAFNQVICFQGTLKQAEDAGYSLDRSWREPNGSEGDPQIIREREKEWKIFIVSEPIHVKVPDKILYASENVKITGRLTAVVETVMNEGPADASGQDEAETAAAAAESPDVHPLATVAERFAYVIYK